MPESQILLCGATGALGGAIASRLQARGIPFRALVRPGHSATAPAGIGIEHVVGDLRDPVSLRVAVAGVGTVISTANSVSRVLAGEGDLSIRDVDDRGYANLIAACSRRAWSGSSSRRCWGTSGRPGRRSRMPSSRRNSGSAHRGCTR